MANTVDRWAVLEILRPPCELERRKAARWVAANARDAEDAAKALSALGLTPADGLDAA